MTLFARLLAWLGVQRQAGRPMTRVVRSVTTTFLPSGRRERRVTSEWRHGNCPVRHKSQKAAARCRRA